MQRGLRQLAFILFLGMLLAWVLGVAGLNRPYVERIALAVISEYVAIYVIAEGSNIALERAFGALPESETLGDDDDAELEQLPEAEQIAGA